ncbi:MAG: WXG100 family type VII secretion target [Clostridia bacterium]|nr:WXG100 family type VII secretion target [Clostridia bacterium]
MAERILVTTEKIQDTYSKYESARSELSSICDQMNNTVHNLDGFWDGPASEVFMSTFRILYDNIKTSDVHMEDAINELKKAENFYSETETQVTNTGGNIDTGNPYQI